MATEVSERLMALRKLAGVSSRVKMAKMLGIKNATYTSWESGVRQMSLEQASMVCAAIGCSIEELTGDVPIGHYRVTQVIDEYFMDLSEQGRALVEGFARLVYRSEMTSMDPIEDD